MQNAVIVDKGYTPAGKPVYPSDDGFDGLAYLEELEVGSRVDRYGSLGGRFVAPEGTPFPNRALPIGSKKEPYNVFEVMAPIDAWGGRTASWFCEPGGGYRYMFCDCDTVMKLINKGKLKIVFDHDLQIALRGVVRSFSWQKIEDVTHNAVCD